MWTDIDLTGVESTQASGLTWDFVERLKAQQPRLKVVWLCENGAEPLESTAPADGV